MGNAVWLVMATPTWIFSIPAIAVIGLVVCMIVAVARHELGLVQFFIPFALSEALVGVAGFFRGKLSDPSGILLAFLFLEALICGLLIYLLRESRVASSALAVLCLIYALLAAGIASMSFTDTWL